MPLSTALHDLTARAVLLAQGDAFDVTPDPGNAPGANALQEVLSGLVFYGLIAGAFGFIASAIAFGAGRWVSNDRASTSGKVGMLVAAAAVFLLGAMGAILNFAYDTGSSA